MDIFRSVTQTVLGSQQLGNPPSGAETVERLIDRVQSSTLLEDRRDGCRALKSLSRKYRLLVGAHGMDTLIQVLESDRNDHEILNYALETLVNVTSDEVFAEEEEDGNFTELEKARIGEQFTEIFTKRTENIALVMSLIDEFVFKIRFPAMKLLNNLLQNRPKELQEAVLVTPSGVSKLMDLLSDSREVIRNDTLLLLSQLTRGNTNLQKIIVFENAYDHLFEIIKDEGFSEGGVVVEDCLNLMLNLLKNNPSNQTLYKEGQYIQKMTDFFELPLDETEVGWSAQKVANVHYMLRLVRTLVSPQNSAQVVTSCQKKMKCCGLLEKLCSLLMAIGVPADILSDTIVAVSEMIRGCQENQEYFLTVSAPSSPPRPAIVVLLMSMVNDKQPFILRCAVLYCFQCFLYRNTSSQAQIVQTLLPQTADASQITAGQLLCGGLFASDSVTNWFSAIALSHALLDNTTQKEQLLRVQLATGTGSPPVSLLQQCASLLESGSKIMTRLGILQLLCTWVARCPIAVTHLLTIPGVIPHLTAYVGSNEHDEMEIVCQGVCAFLLGLCGTFNDDSVPNFTRTSIFHLLYDRIGMENFTHKVENILKAEAYSKAAKEPQLNAQQPSDIVFDHEFTKLFKSLEETVTPRDIENGSDSSHHTIMHLQETVKQQEEEIKQLRNSLSDVQQKFATLNSEHKLCINNANNIELNTKELHKGLNGSSDIPVGGSEDSSKIKQLEDQLTEMTYARDYYYYQMTEKENLLQNQQQTSNNSVVMCEGPEVDNLRKQLEDLQLMLHKRDEEIHTLKINPTVNASDEANQRLQEEKPSIESSLGQLVKEKSVLEVLLKETERRCNEKIKEMELKLSNAVKESTSTLNELKKVQSEQDDLLVLLTDQEAEIADLKQRLVKMGETFYSDESDEDINLDEVVDLLEDDFS